MIFKSSNGFKVQGNDRDVYLMHLKKSLKDYMRHQKRDGTLNDIGKIIDALEKEGLLK